MCENEKNHAVSSKLCAIVISISRRSMRYISSHDAKASSVHNAATMNMAQFMPKTLVNQPLSSENGHIIAARSGWRNKAYSGRHLLINI